MDFTPTDAQKAVQEKAREFAQKVLAPRAEKLDREGGFPTESLAQAAQWGLLGINLPKELGGMGAGVVAYSLAMMQTAAVCASTTVAMCVSNMVGEVVAKFGNSDQRSEHVPRLCNGSYVVGAFALSEAEAGSDPGGMRTRARKTDKGWVLNGSKLWITSGTDAGLFVVWARTSDEPGTRGISAFLVRGDAPGLTRGKPEHKMGLCGSTTTPLDFVDCEVGPEALLDEPGRGFPVAMMALDGGRIGIASQALGLGYAATERARERALERKQFGRPISEFQGVQWQLADSVTELDAGKMLTLQAAWLKDQGRAFSRQASIAKVWSTEKAFAACNRALQILGGHGYTRRSPVERYLRDVRVTMIYEGTSEVQRIVISRDIAKRFDQGS